MLKLKWEYTKTMYGKKCMIASFHAMKKEIRHSLPQKLLFLKVPNMVLGGE